MDTDETEMMFMMQNMENLQDFSSPINEFHFTLEINNNNSTNSNPLPQIIDNPYLNSPTFINPNSTISFTHSPPVPDSAISTTITGQFHGIGIGNINPTRNSMAAMREMIFRVSAMQPIHIDPESVKPPKRRNVKISKDPQSVAARRRRERISERIRILQRIVPGGTKLDTASMLDEAIHYVKFLKSQLQSLQREAAGDNRPAAMCSGNYFRGNSHQTSAVQSLQQFLDV